MRGHPKLIRRDDSPYWFIYCPPGYERPGHTRISTRETDRSQAERVFAQWLLERQKPRIIHEDLILVNDLLERYGSEKKGAATFHLRHLKPFYQGVAVSQFSGTSEYISHRLSQNVIIGKKAGESTVRPSTVRREIDTLIGAFNKAKKDGYLRNIPYIAKPPASPPRERWLTLEEMGRLFEAAKSNWKLEAYLEVAINTAARPSSILELKWFQIDLEKRLIHFNPEGRGQTKKHRPTVYINDSLLSFLQRLRRKAKTEYLLGGVRSVQMAFKRAIKRAGIHNATPYTLRHTAITWLIRDGHSLALAGQLAGHKDPRTTMRYAKHDPSFTETATGALSAGVELAKKMAKSGKKQPPRASKSK